MATALLSGMGELLGRLDVLADNRLIYVADVRRQPAAGWLVERYELIGESARRIESQALAETDTDQLPRPERVYLGDRALHPLVVFDAELGEMLFFNARRGRQRGEYLSYTTGRTLDHADMGGETRALLARVLACDVGEVQIVAWEQASHAEEGPIDAPAHGVPRRLGEFELMSVLGRGGMGVVYRAWQPSLGRQVAVKELVRSGDAKAEARFGREIRALGRVEHPHLVRVFTSGADGEHWFYAMELIEGAALSAVCDKLAARSSVGNLDVQTWHEVLSTVCEESRRAEQPLSDGRNPADPASRAGPDLAGDVAPEQSHLPAHSPPRHAGSARQAGPMAHRKSSATQQRK